MSLAVPTESPRIATASYSEERPVSELGSALWAAGSTTGRPGPDRQDVWSIGSRAWLPDPSADERRWRGFGQQTLDYGSPNL